MKSPDPLLSRLLQALFLVAIWLALDRLAHRLGIPVPAGVIGLAVVTVLLLSGRLSPQRIESGANWLLAEMPLFFIPSMLAITGSGTVFERYGLNLLAAILTGSALVLAGTGLAVDRMFRFESRQRAELEKDAQP